MIVEYYSAKENSLLNSVGEKRLPPMNQRTCTALNTCFLLWLLDTQFVVSVIFWKYIGCAATGCVKTNSLGFVEKKKKKKFFTALPLNTVTVK